MAHEHRWKRIDIWTNGCDCGAKVGKPPCYVQDAVNAHKLSTADHAATTPDSTDTDDTSADAASDSPPQK